MKTLIRSLSMFGALFVLAACGGGGGGGGGGDGGGGSATPANGWGTAALIDTDNAGEAQPPQIASDASGNAIAVWSQFDGARSNIYANRYTATTGTWGTAALIETDNTGDALEPQIAIDASGNAIAVWRHFNGSLYSMWANRYVPGSGRGSGWGTAAGIDIDLTNVFFRDAPRLAVDAGGNAIAVWSRGDNAILSIYAVRYVPGTGWGTPTLIETDNTGNASSPQIAFDASGNAIAVWRQLVTVPFGQRYGIRTNRYTAGTGWGTATLIETGLSINNSFSPQIAIDASGNAIAVWSRVDVARSNIYANRYTATTGTWGTAALIEFNNAGEAQDPKIAFDASGNAIAVWRQFDARDSIYAVQYMPGTDSWGPALLIETGTGQAESPQIAFDASGNAIAVWSQFDGTRSSIYANRYTAGNWGTPTLIETDNTGPANYPQIAIDTGGNAIAVWSQFDGARSSIYANRYQ